MSEFFTISEPVEGFLKEKGSKFLSFAYPVNSVEAFEGHLQSLKKEHPQANHHCFGYIIGTDQRLFRSYDDGEPNHSAGDPILGQIKSYNKTNCAVVVVRYFGGTKLGVGGLVSAYKEAAKLALDNATDREIKKYVPVTLLFNYDKMGMVERKLSAIPDLIDVDRLFQDKCKITFKIEEKYLEQVDVETMELNQIKVQLGDHIEF